MPSPPKQAPRAKRAALFSSSLPKKHASIQRAARFMRSGKHITAIKREIGPRRGGRLSSVRFAETADLRIAAQIAAEKHINCESPFKDRGDILVALSDLRPGGGLNSKQRFAFAMASAHDAADRLDMGAPHCGRNF